MLLGNPMPEYKYKDTHYDGQSDDSSDGLDKQLPTWEDKLSKEDAESVYPPKGSFADEMVETAFNGGSNPGEGQQTGQTGLMEDKQLPKGENIISKEDAKDTNPLKGSFADEMAGAVGTGGSTQAEGKKQNAEIETGKTGLSQEKQQSANVESDNHLKLNKELLDKIDTETLQSVLEQRKEQSREDDAPPIEDVLQENFNDARLNENLKVYSQNVKEMLEQHHVTSTKQQKVEPKIKPTPKYTEKVQNSQEGLKPQNVHIASEQSNLQNLQSIKNLLASRLPEKPYLVTGPVSQLKHIDIENELNANLIDSSSSQNTKSKEIGKVVNLVPSVLTGRESKEPGDKYVTLKIVGVGKPASFKTDSSKDGSIVLRLPENVKVLGSVEADKSATAAEPKSNEPETLAVQDQISTQSLKTETPNILNNIVDGNAVDVVNNNRNNNNNEDNENNNKGNNNSNDSVMTFLTKQISANRNWQILGKTGSQIVREPQRDEKGSLHNTIGSVDISSVHSQIPYSVSSSSKSSPPFSLSRISSVPNLSPSFALPSEVNSLVSNNKNLQIFRDLQRTANTETANSKFTNNHGSFNTSSDKNQPPQTIHQLLAALVREVQAQRQTKQDFPKGISQATNTKLGSSYKAPPFTPVTSLSQYQPLLNMAKPSSKDSLTMVAGPKTPSNSIDLTKKERDFEESELASFDKGNCIV